MASEKKYENVIKNKLQAKGWWVRKLHGNLYQEGLPDLLLCRPTDGMLMMCEMKGNENATKLVYLQIEIIELLKGPQVGNFMVLWKMSGMVCIILGTPVGYFIVRNPIIPTSKVYALHSDEVIEELTGW